MKHLALRPNRGRHRLLGRHLLVAAFAAAFLGGCTFGQAPEPTPIPLLFTTPGAVPGASRQVYAVQRGEIVDELSFGAQVALDKREDLFFGAPGRVQDVYVQSGEEVKLDQVIAVLDTRTLELDRQAAAETLKLAQERLALAEANLRFARLQREADLQAEKLKLQQIESRPDHETGALQARPRPAGAGGQAGRSGTSAAGGRRRAGRPVGCHARRDRPAEGGDRAGRRRDYRPLCRAGAAL